MGTKNWMVPMEKRDVMEKILNQGKHEFSYDAIALKMVNGGYKEFEMNEKENKAKTLRLALIEDRLAYDQPLQPVVIVEYVGGYPDKTTLEMLAQDYYMKVRNETKEVIVGKFIDSRNAWGWPVKYYFDVVEVLRKLPQDKFKLVRMSEGFERCHRKSQTTQKETVNIDLNEDMLTRLYPFQRAGIEEGIRRNGRVLIADEMGLGKTIQAIGIVGHFSRDLPLLIVAPSSVKFNWLVELNNWLPDKIDDKKVQVLYTGKDTKEIKDSLQVIPLISYYCNITDA